MSIVRLRSSHIDAHGETRARRNVEQRIEAEFVDAPAQQVVHSWLRESEPLGRDRLRCAPVIDRLADRHHQPGARLHARRRGCRGLDRIPNVVELPSLHCVELISIY